MTNPFYQPGDQRRAAVNDLFAAIAGRYDLINDVLSLGLHRVWKRRVAVLAGAGPGRRALDLCCGTGDIALALARRGARVVGLDFSAPMLERARARSRRISAGEAGNPQYLRGDAQQIPFRDGSFDLVTVGYGLRNLASWETGLREMCRVVRPGGRVVVLDFGKPDNAVWRGLYFFGLRFLVPLLGLLCGNGAAYAYILESLKHYPAQRGVADQMRRLGFAPVRVRNVFGGMMSIQCGDKPG